MRADPVHLAERRRAAVQRTALLVALLLLAATAVGMATMALAPRFDAFLADGRVARVPIGTTIAASNVEIGWEARIDGEQASVLTPMPEIPYFGFMLAPALDDRNAANQGALVAVLALALLALLARRSDELVLLAGAGLLLVPRFALATLPDLVAPLAWSAIPLLVAGLLARGAWWRLILVLGAAGSLAAAVPGFGTWTGAFTLPIPWREDVTWAPTWIASGLIAIGLLPGAYASARLAAAGGDRRTLPVRLAAALIPGGASLRLALAERERRELADRIHNEVLPELGSALARLDASDLEAAAALRTAEERLRALMSERRNVALEAVGLGPALDDLCRRFDGPTAPEIERVIELGDRPPRYVELAALRVAEAAVANAVAHAGARRVVVEAVGDAGSLQVAIRDDGRGFPAAEAARAAERGHLGLHGMREWAGAVGAALAIESAPGAGTRVVLRWPAA